MCLPHFVYPNVSRSARTGWVHLPSDQWEWIVFPPKKDLGTVKATWPGECRLAFIRAKIILVTAAIRPNPAQWALCPCPVLPRPCLAECGNERVTRQLHLPQLPPAVPWQPARSVEHHRPGRPPGQSLLHPLQPGTLPPVWIRLHPGTHGRNRPPLCAAQSVLNDLWPCLTRFWRREMKPCGSAARRRRTMRAPRGTPSSCQPGTSCQWSLGVTTLTRADSPASEHFTPRKVMQKSWHSMPGGRYVFVGCNYTKSNGASREIIAGLHSIVTNINIDVIVFSNINLFWKERIKNTVWAAYLKKTKTRITHSWGKMQHNLWGEDT